MRRSAILALLLAAVVAAGCGKPAEKRASGEAAKAPAAGKPVSTQPEKAPVKPDGPTAETNAAPSAEPPRSTGDSRDKQGTVASAASSIPIYPGAKKMPVKLSPDQAKAVQGQRFDRYSTSASHKQVVDWYSARMKGGLMRTGSGEGVQHSMMILPNRKTSELQQVMVETKGKQTVITAVSRRVPRKALDEFDQMAAAGGKGGPAASPKLPDTMKVDENVDRAASRIGMPTYPGAKAERGAVVTDKRAPGVEQVMLQASTDKKPAEVMGWYKGELKSRGAQEIKSPEGQAALVYKDDAGYVHGVRAQVHQGKTVILLTKMKMPAPRGDKSSAGAASKSGN